MITTRNPFSPLAHTLDRMSAFGRVFDDVLPEIARNAAPIWMPALEVAERSDAYLIAVDLPGVREDQIELSFENNVLTLRGSRTSNFSAQKEGEMRVHISERQTGAFERSVRLPEFVEGDRIEARYVDGVLHVTVPKSPAAQPRKIPVSSRGALGGEGSAEGPAEVHAS